MSASTPQVWSGSVWHHRLRPTDHQFSYRLWWADLDVDDIEATLSKLMVLSDQRWRPLRFDRADYYGDASTPLGTSLRDLVESRTGTRPTGSIRLLANLRTLGWCFNPISLYLCHDDHGDLAWIVADVTNTPWKERHQYVMAADRSGVHGHLVDKALHVSPFMPMDQQYRFDIDVDPSTLRVRIDTIDHGDTPFQAGVELRCEPMTNRTLLAALVRHPMLTMRISLAIRTQALRLWRKRVPLHRHPDRRADAQEVHS